MPRECPLGIEEALGCSGCRYQSSDKCWWFFPSRNVLDILTLEERITRIEKPKEVTTIYTRINIDSKALELQKRIVSLEEENKKKTHAYKKSTIYKYK